MHLVEGANLVAARIAHTVDPLRLSRSRWEKDDASRCERPVLIEWTGRPYKERPMGLALQFDHWVNCRKCESCLARRAAHWQQRCLAECKLGVRTWFVTLTFRPEEHYRAELLARRRLRERAVAFDSLSADRRFAEVHSEHGKEITRYLKRIRKASGARFRYFVVCEKHVSGLHHYHLLVHEIPGGGTLRHAVLASKWRLGFGQWKLIGSLDVARYVTKYLSKATQARVRASRGYGTSSISEAVSAAVHSVFDHTVQTPSQFIQDLGVWVGLEGNPDKTPPVKFLTITPNAGGVYLGSCFLEGTRGESDPGDNA